MEQAEVEMFVGVRQTECLSNPHGTTGGLCINESKNNSKCERKKKKKSDWNLACRVHQNSATQFSRGHLKCRVRVLLHLILAIRAASFAVTLKAYPGIDTRTYSCIYFTLSLVGSTLQHTPTPTR